MNDNETIIMLFEDVEEIFNTCQIWNCGYEKYWYQKAWSILVKHNLTSCTKEIDRYKVMMYAFALVHIYWQFCKEAFDEYPTDIYDPAMDFIPDVIIGQIAAAHLKDGEVYENAGDALNAIITDVEAEVFTALGKHMSAQDVFLWMYSTNYSFDEDADISSFENFQKALQDDSWFILNNVSGAGYEYIRSWIE